MSALEDYDDSRAELADLLRATPHASPRAIADAAKRVEKANPGRVVARFLETIPETMGDEAL